MKFVVVLLFVTITSLSLFAQAGAAAFAVATMQQSTLMMGAGRVGASLPVNDAMGYYLNPAQLGINKQTMFQTYVMTENARWLDKLFSSNYYFRNYSASAQLDFGQLFNSSPISVGVGYAHMEIQMGKFRVTGPVGPEIIATYTPIDKLDAFSISAGYHAGFDASIGFTVKQASSRLDYDRTEKFSAFDFGGMFRLPYAFKQVQLADAVSVVPVISFTLGTSLTNIGKDINYIDRAQKDPQARTSYLGYSLHGGLCADFYGEKINLLDYYFTIEADAYMFRRDTTGKVTNEHPFYGLRPLENLIGLRSSQYVNLHRGNYIGLAETVYLTWGNEQENGTGTALTGTNAMVLSTEGVVKAAAALTNNSIVKGIAKYAVLEYHRGVVKYKAGAEYESKFPGVVIRIKNFPIGK